MNTAITIGLPVLLGVLLVGEGSRRVGNAARELLQSRGIRNNNPGNLRRTDDQWRGLADEQTDPEFFQFAAPVYGIRAMARVLQNYQAVYGLDTIAEIITRWAPPGENPTAAYIAHVSRETGIPSDQPINVAAHLDELVPAMIAFENHGFAYPPSTVLQGVLAA